MKTAIVHLLSNAAFLAALLAAVHWEIGWLRVLVIGFVWFMLAMYFMVLADAGSRARFRARTEPIPLLVTAAIDAAALLILLDTGWHVTAAAYGVSAAVAIALYGRHRLFTWTMDR